MTARRLRYQPAPEWDVALRETIVTLAHLHRRYGAGMMYLKLRQQGQMVNDKRVERIFTDATPQAQEDAVGEW